MHTSNAVRRFAGSALPNGIIDSSVIGSSIIRLPKAIAMFASRACRKSIMVGTALSHKEQTGLLTKLDKCEVPWNCAHGRVSDVDQLSFFANTRTLTSLEFTADHESHSQFSTMLVR